MEQPAEMQDSEVATAADEPELDSSVDEALDDADDNYYSTDDETDGEPEEVASDDEEIDYDGEKFKVPAKLKEAFLRQQDYTKKTQEVAEQRKAVEAHYQEVQRQAQVQQQNFADYAKAYNLDNQLKQYAQLDWNALMDADPVQAMKLDREMRNIEAERNNTLASITQKQQQQALQTQQETAKRMQEGRAVLEREIKGWQPGNEVDLALASYAKSYGVENPAPAIADNPKIALILHKAWQFDQLMEKQATKPKPAPQEKPVTRIAASKGTASKDPSQMSSAEFAKWRQSQIKRRSA